MARAALLAAALGVGLVVACSQGGGGGGPPPPPPSVPTGQLDASFGGGKVIVEEVSGVREMLFDAAGNIYLFGGGIAKLDANGTRVASFGTGGFLSLVARDALTDPAGNLYVLTSSGVFQPALVKLDANGQRVPGFGSGGEVALGPFNPSPSVDMVEALLRDAQGNLYVIGSSDDPTGNPSAIVVMKLDANGVPVESFGARGLRMFAVPGAVRPFARTAAFDRDANIVVLGDTQVSTGPLSFAFKVDARGELLASFGESGFWRAASCQAALDGLAVDARGDVYVGAMCTGTDSNAMVATVFRLDSSGRPVGSFGTGGIKTNAFEDSLLQRAALASVGLDGAGNLYVAGSSSASCPADFMVARLAPDGSLVPSFGLGGRVSLDIGGVNDRATVVRFDASGRLYLGGFTTSVCPIMRPVQLPAAVARLLP